MRSIRLSLFLSIILSVLFTAVPAKGQSAGDNVNMVSGTGWTNGDPFLQRQNEPSMAVSTRNTLHLLAGANDYRNVDVPGLLGIDVQGDAWVGLFKSFDGGQTWQSTLLPGYPLDSSPQGTGSPIHGFQAAADPVVRAGTNGLFYYSGIAFNRGTGGLGVVFVSRFVDNNNKENGDPTNTNGSLTNLAPTDPINYLGTTVIGRGTSSTFLDKPWIATDIPRGTATCPIPYTKPDGTTGTQTIPAGRVFATYAALNGTLTSNIMFSYSNDCGMTWSSPVTLSQKKTLNQGAMIVVAPTYDEDNDNDTDPEDAVVYVVWRKFGSGNTPSALMIAKSTDGGESFSSPVAAMTFPASCNTTPTGTGCIFDQGTSGSTFRTTAYPALTVDDTGRVYLAWSQRQASGDARIMMNVSLDGQNWSSTAGVVDNGPVLDDSGNPFSNLSGHGHQLMPSLTFSAGKLSLLYFDFREDHTLGQFTIKPDLSGYNETRQFEGELAGNPGSNLVFNTYVSDAAPPLTSRRHTVDVQGAQAAPLAAGSLGVPAFTSYRVSRYLFGINPFDSANQAEQLQVDTPDLPMFEQGTVPFFGDYIDLAPTPAYVLNGGAWKFNTSASNLPVYHAVWTDNRDVVPPPDGNWTHYVPPFSASNPSGPHQSLFDPTQTVPQCQVGINDGFTASRNQNIYTSIVAPGLVVGSLGNSKPLGFSATNPTQLLQRAFEITLRNTTTLQRSFRITIGNQPALANGQPDPQGVASLLQNSLQTSLDVTISAQSSIARAVFIQSANPTASVTVNAQEINAPNGTLISGGLQSFVTFNPDPSAPLLLDPDNLGFSNPAVLSAETHNPAIANPAIANPAIANPAIANPAIANPAIANPAIANPAIANPAVVAALNPAIANPAIANPAIANPAIANPAIANQSVTDAVYPLTNAGNTTTSYAVKLFQKSPLPPGINLQLILTKQFLTPVAQGCELKQQIQNVVVANIANPVFTPAANLGDPNLPDPSVTNATLALRPGETGQIVIRANVSNASDMQNLVLNNLAPVGVAHPANTGVAIPPATLTILNQTLPDGIVGTPYSGQVNIFGGVGADTVSVTNGALPSGLTINASTGAITGTPTGAGSFTFTVQVMDSATTPATATQAFTIRIANPLVIAPPSGADGVVNAAYSVTLNASGGIGSQTWSLASGSSLPTGLTLSSAGVISGTPTQVSSTGTSVTAQVQDSSSPAQTTSLSLTIHIAPVLTITTASGQLPDAVIGSAYNYTFTSNGGITPIQWTLTSGTLPPGLTLGTGGTLTGTPTASGNYTFTVQAGDASSPSQTITVNVGINSPVALVINTTAGALPDAVVGASYNNFQLSLTGGTGPFTWTVSGGALPSGMTLSSAGVIGGAPASPNPSPTPLTFQVQDSGSPAQTKTVNMTIRVAAPLVITTVAGSLPDVVQGVAYNLNLGTTGGIGPLAWSATGSLPPGVSLSNTGALTGTPTSAGTYAFTVQLQDASNPAQSKTVALSLRVDVPLVITTQAGSLSDAIQNANYSSSLVSTGGTTPLNWTLSGGTLPPGILLSGTGTLSGSPTTTGTYPFTAQVTDSSNPAQVKNVAESIRVDAPLVISTASGSLPDSIQGASYNFNLVTAGGTTPLAWSVAAGGLPPGITLGSTGALNGSPTATGTYSFTVQVTDASTPAQVKTVALSLRSDALLAITTASLPDAVQGVAYSGSLTSNGGTTPLVWSLSAGALPPGITLGGTGTLSGSPTSTGTYSFTAQLTDSSAPAQIRTAILNIRVAAPLVINTPSGSLPDAVQGTTYSYGLLSSGGITPTVWSISGGQLPPGVALSTAGTLTGSPTATGTYSFTAQLQDASNPAQVRSVALSIRAAAPLVITTPAGALPSAMAKVAYNITLATSGGNGPVTWSLTAGTLPPGLTINSSGKISGVPTQTGTFAFTVKAGDGSSPQQLKTAAFSIKVTCYDPDHDNDCEDRD